MAFTYNRKVLKNPTNFSGTHLRICVKDATPLVFVFEITKTKTPKFTVKFDLKLGGKNRTEDNLTD